MSIKAAHSTGSLVSVYANFRTLGLWVPIVKDLYKIVLIIIIFKINSIIIVNLN